MRALQRAGGLAALVTAGTYLVGLVVLGVVVLALHAGLRASAPALAATGAAFGLLWGGLLIASGMVHLVGQQAVVALAISDPQTASTVWASVRVVRDALGGGIELVGAVWVLLVALALLRCQALQLGGLGIAAGLAGACTLVPAALDAAAVVFGVAMIVWFIWTGVSLLHGALHG